MYGCDIPLECKIGENVFFAHSALGTVIHKNAQIGNNVFIQHHVTIGMNHSAEEGLPVIHDNVFIGPYAIILGPVEIGEGAIIGAGSLVMHNIEPHSCYTGSNSLVKRK